MKGKGRTLGKKDPCQPVASLPALQPGLELLEIPLALETTVTSSSTVPGKHLVICIPGPFLGTIPNSHVVQGTPATVRVPRAQTFPTGRILLTGFHGDPGDLAER